MTIQSLLSQLEELSRQWRERDCTHYPDEFDSVQDHGYDAAADELDFLIVKAKSEQRVEAATSTGWRIERVDNSDPSSPVLGVFDPSGQSQHFLPDLLSPEPDTVP